MYIAAKATKFIDVEVRLLSSEVITGRFHVDATTSSTIRPSDAFRQIESDFILLSDATISHEGQSRELPVVLLRASSIAAILIQKSEWQTGSVFKSGFQKAPTNPPGAVSTA